MENPLKDHKKATIAAVAAAAVTGVILVSVNKSSKATGDVPFIDGTVIQTNGTYLVTADTNADAKSVVFEIDGALVKEASTPPFDCQWDAKTTGNHVFKATPWSNPNVTGIKGETITVNYIVSDTATRAYAGAWSTDSSIELDGCRSGLQANRYFMAGQLDCAACRLWQKGQSDVDDVFVRRGRRCSAEKSRRRARRKSAAAAEEFRRAERY